MRIFFEYLFLHEGVAYAVGLPFELREPAVVDDAVDARRRNLVVSEDRPPAGELHIRGDHDRLSLVSIREYLEHEASPVGVERQEPSSSMTSRAARPIYDISWASLPPSRVR